MNTSQIKNFAIQSRKILMEGVLNRIISLGFDIVGNLTIDRPIKIQGGTIFMGQLQDEAFFEAWTSLEQKIKQHKDNAIKNVCEEAAYTWFNRLVAIRIMQKNKFIEPVMQYVSETSRIPMIVDEARSGRLSLNMSASDRAKLDELLRDSTKTNEQFNILISAFCESNPVIFKCFGGIEKYIKLLLPDNILAQGGFIDLLNNTSYLTEDDYKQSELIGWLYQFYISEKKDEVFESFKKGGKAEAEDIPAATQIFTPNWIVKYMVQNTLGRIYLDNNPYSTIGENMKYLVKTDEPTPEETILHFDDLQDYKMIDPACGSGHILVEAFDLLFLMYQEEAYPTRMAIEQILSKNIIGIDLDTRAKQLATFALLMKACMKDRSFLDCKVMPRVLDMPKVFADIYSSPLCDFFPHYFLGCDSNVNKECCEAFELLKQADNLGSIMKFSISDETRAAIERRTAEWEKEEFIPELISQTIPSMKLILALTDKYSSVVANPPYMGNGNMPQQLKEYVDKEYPFTSNDLGVVFLDVAYRLCQGKFAFINQATWLFKPAYLDYRRSIIDNRQYYLENLLYLGPGTFDEIKGEVVQSVCFTISKGVRKKTIFYYLKNKRSSSEKRQAYLNNEVPPYYVTIDSFKDFKGLQFGFWINKNVIHACSDTPLSRYGDAKQGLKTGDNPRFIRLWFEIDGQKFESKWFPVETGGLFRKWYGNSVSVLNWENDGFEIKNFRDENGKLKSRPQGLSYAFKKGLTWSTSASDKQSFRYSNERHLFESSGSKFFLKIEGDESIFCAFFNSKVCKVLLEIFSPGLGISEGAVKGLPFISPVSKEFTYSLAQKNISISKQDWDAHETSWDFKTNELLRMKYNCSGNVADLDLLDPEEAKEIMEKYKVPTNGNRISDCLSAYKSEWTRNFNRLHNNEEELNRQFIEIYGLQDELTPDVPLNEITILQQGEISIENNEIVWHDDVIIKQLLSYAIGCWMGRYRLDKEGLNIAHYPTPEEVCSYEVNGYTFDIDDDAIIPLMGKDTPFEDDNALQKIVNFVKFTFGEDNLSENLNFIENCLGKSIEDYLIKDLWKDHKKMYQNRPIYWLFSSKKGAFQVLAYMHRMNPYTVEKIRTKYLLPYIEHLKGKIEIDEARGSDLTTIERKNLTKMKTALDECIEYHDRLHDVALKAIDFDLDDGVVVNYAKFGDVLAKIK